MKTVIYSGLILFFLGFTSCNQFSRNHETPEEFDALVTQQEEFTVTPNEKAPPVREGSRSLELIDHHPSEAPPGAEILSYDYTEAPMRVDRKAETTTPTLSKEPTTGYTGKSIQPKAGTLTAGEINDFSKWVLWNDLTENAFQNFSKTWGFSLKERYSVQLTYPGGLPAVDVEVNLVNEKNVVVYTARTDNTGKAELWGNIFGVDSLSGHSYHVTVNAGRKPQTFKQIHSFQNGINHLRIKGSCSVSEQVDIAFVVDATGSMGDEIQYLKTELMDVLSRVKHDNPDIQLNTGAVFYRDHGDAYLTQHHPLSNNLESIIQFIKEQNAAGGGDFPEAVDDALDVALNTLVWSDHSRARLLFLVLDAPPHQNPKVLKRMKSLVEKAAQMGVRIIPVTGSGINKDVEFLMRSMALATNGTYTFLTNHSGIGGKHIEPSTDSYSVEKLNDLLVRLINRYAAVLPCEQPVALTDTTNHQNTVLQPSDSLNPAFQLGLNCYPNPSFGPITFEVNRGGGVIHIFDNNGKLVARFEIEDQLKHQTDIRQLASGYYFVVYEWQGMKVTKPIVLRSNLS